MTRMALKVSTYPGKRLSRTMGYGVQGTVRNEIATPERPPNGSPRKDSVFHFRPGRYFGVTDAGGSPRKASR